MGAAETLANDPEFATLHEGNPTLAEDLMTKALQKDAAAIQQPSLSRMEGRTPLEGNMTDDRGNSTTGEPMLSLGESAANVGRTVRNTVLPTAGGMAGAFVGGMTGPAAPVAVPVLSGLGAEAGNVANKALGWQPGKWNEPDMSDVLALTTPAATQVLRHPVATVKNIVAPFAKSSQMGQEAANSAVQLQNAKLGADFDWSVASQDKAKAIAGLDYEQQVASWNTLKAAQVTAKRQAAEDLRTLTTTLKSRNVVDAANWAAHRPGVPTDIEVREAFTAADTIAQAHATPLILPELVAAKKIILAEAELAAKTPGIGKELASVLTRVGNQGALKGTPSSTQTTIARPASRYDPAGSQVSATTGTAVGELTLTEMQNSVKYLNDRIAQLRNSPDKYSVARRDALGKVVTALETGMERLEADPTNPIAFRSAVKTANTLYLKKRTNEEVNKFMTHDVVTPDASGQPQLDPRAAMKAIDSKGNERMVGYMKKVKPPDGNGKNLYEMTKDTLTQMASVGQAEWEAQRLLTKTGGMAVPPKPTNPLPSPNALPYPHPQGGLASAVGTLGLRAAGAGAGFALGGGSGNPYTSIPSAAVGVGAPEVFAKLMQTGWGQRTLLALVQHQGRTISPALVGLATAAVRAGEPDAAPAPVAPTP